MESWEASIRADSKRDAIVVKLEGAIDLQWDKCRPGSCVMFAIVSKLSCYDLYDWAKE